MSAEFRSTFDRQDPASIWSTDDQQRVLAAYKKAEVIQGRIDSIVLECVLLPGYKDKFPELFDCIVNAMPKASEIISQSVMLSDINNMIERLKKDDEPLTVDYLKEVRQIFREIDDSSPVITDVHLALLQLRLCRELTFHFSSFIQRNKESLTAPDLCGTLFEKTDSIQGRSCEETIQKNLADLNKALVSIDGIMQDYPTAFDQFQDLLPPALKCIQISSLSLLPLSKTPLPVGNNPLGFGFALLSLEAQRHQHASLEQNVRSEEFLKKSSQQVHEYFSQKRSYVQTVDKESRYQAALQIINNSQNGALNVPLPHALDTFCVASRDSNECPRFFKDLAMQLCTKIESYKLEKEPVEEQSSDCCIS